MASQLPRVFLSSTVYDLKDLRNAVQMALVEDGYRVLASEAGTIPVDSTKHSYDVCLEAARSCDCLIAIIDGRFGGAMPDQDKSITLAEIETALENGKHVFAFVRQGVWDAMEVCKSYQNKGMPFVKNKVVEDERVFSVIDTIRKRNTGNWLLQFNLPEDLIRKVRFQLESLESAKSEQLVGWRPDGEMKVETVQLKDISNETAKRYSAFLLIDHPRQKATVHELVAKVTEQLKTETYHRSERFKQLWAEQRAHVIWTYVGTSVEDISSGNWLCRSLWIDPMVEEKLSIHKLGGDERFNGIEFIWNAEYTVTKAITDAHRVSKGEVMERAEQLANALLQFGEIAKAEFLKFERTEISESDLARRLQAHITEVSDLYRECSDLPPGPVDTREAVDACNLLGGSVDEIYQAYSSRSMQEKTAMARRVRFETGLSQLRKDISRWEFALEKAHHG